MEKNVVTQAVGHQRVVLVVGLEGTPVVVELLGTKHKYRLVAVLIILDNRKCRDGLTETYGVGKDAAIILFKFVDESKCSIFLEVVEFVPDDAILESRSSLGKTSSLISSRNSLKIL